ncbi:ATP-binding protein [Streptomyces mobaraensis]|uniref:ATP-binding protein n=1 Tax=Streptomyces mobaraensis TaxID=35621 RepID=A0A5N5W2Q4_STRMB|nr:ATP-binding protein [Streptomyces mobaraensis]KAB7835497.1 ATP-binding protein [Streptomyces mobaraensis]
MPSTAAELIQNQALGHLVDHRACYFNGVAEPLLLARRTVRDALHDRADRERVDDAVLATDELVANALRHVGGPVSLTLDLYEKGAAVGVADRGTDITAIPAAPASLLADLDDVEAGEIGDDDLPEGGQGLFLVAHCATAWCVDRTAAGKIVTAVFLLTGSDV